MTEHLAVNCGGSPITHTPHPFSDYGDPAQCDGKPYAGSSIEPATPADRTHFDPEFGTPPPCGGAEPWEAKTTDRDAVTCHMCDLGAAYLDTQTERTATPESVTDDRGRASYSRALPQPTVEEYAVTVLQFCESPYAAGRQRAEAGFRRTAEMIWRWRHGTGPVDPFAYRVARATLHGFARTVRGYDAMTASWAEGQARQIAGGV